MTRKEWQNLVKCLFPSKTIVEFSQASSLVRLGVKRLDKGCSKDAKAWDAEVVILTSFGRETDRIIN